MGGSRRSIVAALAVALALTGCGGRSDADKAKEALTTFMAAIARGDGKTACGLADAAGRQRLVTAAKGRLSCESVVAAIATRIPPDVRTGLENAEIRRVTVRGNTATVDDADITSSKGRLSGFLNGDTPEKLVKEGGRWKVSGG
jgi:hypothetical protein